MEQFRVRVSHARQIVPDSQSIVHWSQLVRNIFSRVNSKSAMLVALHLITRPGILLASRVLCC